MISTVVRNSIIAAVLACAALVGTCVTGYVSAQRTGDESEKEIASANALAKAELAALTEQLTTVTGMPGLSEMPPAKAFKFAKRWRPRSSRYLAQYASVAQVEELQQEIRLKLASAQKAHNSAENAKNNYQAVLNSKWTGFWLRVGGYPKSPPAP